MKNIKIINLNQNYNIENLQFIAHSNEDDEQLYWELYLTDILDNVVRIKQHLYSTDIVSLYNKPKIIGFTNDNEHLLAIEY